MKFIDKKDLMLFWCIIAGIFAINIIWGVQLARRIDTMPNFPDRRYIITHNSIAICINENTLDRLYKYIAHNKTKESVRLVMQDQCRILDKDEIVKMGFKMINYNHNSAELYIKKFNRYVYAKSFYFKRRPLIFIIWDKFWDLFF